MKMLHVTFHIHIQVLNNVSDMLDIINFAIYQLKVLPDISSIKTYYICTEYADS